MQFTSYENETRPVGYFEATLMFDAAVEAPTIIHALRESEHKEVIWYPNDVQVEVRVKDSDLDPEAKVDIQKNTISISIQNPLVDGHQVSIVVNPQAATALIE